MWFKFKQVIVIVLFSVALVSSESLRSSKNTQDFYSHIMWSLIVILTVIAMGVAEIIHCQVQAMITMYMAMPIENVCPCQGTTKPGTGRTLGAIIAHRTVTTRSLTLMKTTAVSGIQKLTFGLVLS